MTLAEAIRSTEIVTEKLDDENAQVLFGARNDTKLGNTMRVTLIITGVQSPNIFGQETRTPFLTKPKIFKGFARPPADLGLDKI